MFYQSSYAIQFFFSKQETTRLHSEYLYTYEDYDSHPVICLAKYRTCLSGIWLQQWGKRTSPEQQAASISRRGRNIHEETDRWINQKWKTCPPQRRLGIYSDLSNYIRCDRHPSRAVNILSPVYFIFWIYKAILTHHSPHLPEQHYSYSLAIFTNRWQHLID